MRKSYAKEKKGKQESFHWFLAFDPLEARYERLEKSLRWDPDGHIVLTLVFGHFAFYHFGEGFYELSRSSLSSPARHELQAPTPLVD